MGSERDTRCLLRTVTHIFVSKLLVSDLEKIKYRKTSFCCANGDRGTCIAKQFLSAMFSWDIVSVGQYETFSARIASV